MVPFARLPFWVPIFFPQPCVSAFWLRVSMAKKPPGQEPDPGLARTQAAGPEAVEPWFDPRNRRRFSFYPPQFLTGFPLIHKVPSIPQCLRMPPPPKTKIKEKQEHTQQRWFCFWCPFKPSPTRGTLKNNTHPFASSHRGGSVPCKWLFLLGVLLFCHSLWRPL